jgi:CRISPR-associated protein Csy2
MEDSVQGYDRFLKLTGNPLTKEGERPHFIEEGRCHLTVSLVLEVNGLDRGNDDIDLIKEIVSSHLKLAGGDIVEFLEAKRILSDEPFASKLMPGYALIERRSLMRQSMAEGLDALASLHRFLSIHNRSTTDEAGTVTWTRKRETAGWIVPIATGFQALTEPAFPKNARDSSTPHRFAESVVTLGEFVLVSRFKSLSEFLWRYEHNENLYLCTQEAAAST